MRPVSLFLVLLVVSAYGAPRPGRCGRCWRCLLTTPFLGAAVRGSFGRTNFTSGRSQELRNEGPTPPPLPPTQPEPVETTSPVENNPPTVESCGYWTEPVEEPIRLPPHPVQDGDVLPNPQSVSHAFVGGGTQHNIRDLNSALLRRIATNLYRDVPPSAIDSLLKHIETGVQEAVRLRGVYGDRLVQPSRSSARNEGTPHPNGDPLPEGFALTTDGLVYVVLRPRAPTPVITSSLGDQGAVSIGASGRVRAEMGREAAVEQASNSEIIRRMRGSYARECGLRRRQGLSPAGPAPECPRAWLLESGAFSDEALASGSTLINRQPNAVPERLASTESLGYRWFRCGEHQSSFTVHAVGQNIIATIAMRILPDGRIYSVFRCRDCSQYDLGIVLTDEIPEGTWLNAGDEALETIPPMIPIAQIERNPHARRPEGIPLAGPSSPNPPDENVPSDGDEAEPAGSILCIVPGNTSDSDEDGAVETSGSKDRIPPDFLVTKATHYIGDVEFTTIYRVSLSV